MGIPSGPFYINDLLTWTVDTHTVTTGAVTDADSVPTYRIYEDETGTPILTGSMAKLDDAGTTGFYSEQITLSAANGFEVGKCYSIRTTTAVNSVTAANSYNFKVIATPAAALDAAGIRSAVGLASANLDTQLLAIDDAIDTEVGAIKTKTDFLPSATAGASGGLFIAGTNAATVVTGSLTTTFTGNLTGSVGSVTGAVGSVTGAVGSISTGGITTGSFAAGAINAAAIATDAIGAAELAADAVTEIQSGLATAAALTVIDDFLDTEVAAIKVVTDKLDTALELDGAVYRYTTNALEQAPTGGSAPTAAQNATELLDQAAGVETGLTVRQASAPRAFGAVRQGIRTGNHNGNLS